MLMLEKLDFAGNY